MRTAAIGIGSNSLRMLIADIEGNELHRLKRYREGLRVFAALDQNGNISDEMLAKACESVRGFVEQAHGEGAKSVHLFATSAVRDASNQAELTQRLRRETGLTLEICSGDEEAKLSFFGATGGEFSGLIDIGGGSTEIAIGCGTSLDFSVSLQMGAVRLYRVHPIQSVGDADEVVELATGVLSTCKSDVLAAPCSRWVGVGGTFTTTAALVQQIPYEQREHIHGFMLTPANVRLAMEHLAPMPYEKRLKLPYLQPQRADIVVHGIAILYACMRELRIREIMVSECGNLEGYLKQKYIL